ncbi:MAG: hypothetical protein JXR53_06585 [Bacteroidales bacterium]|nr:hypothetical protein [Bacteroidales bacterium]
MKYISLLILVLASCTSQQSNKANMHTDFIQEELQKWNIEVTSEGQTSEIELPKDMDGPNWGLKCLVCEDAGYDLKKHGGEKVKMTRFYTAETISNGDTLDVWVVHNDTEVFCIYKAVGGHSAVAPGIMSVKK